MVNKHGANWLIYRCECGRIRKYGKWVMPDDAMKREIFRNFGKITVIEGKCPTCRVAVKKEK